MAQPFALKIDEKRSYSYALMSVPGDLAAQIKEWGRANVPDDVLDPDQGREDYIHVTVLGGLLTNDPEAVRAVLKANPLQPVKVTLGKVSIFDQPNYDVVKIDVSSPDLDALNVIIAKSSKALPNENNTGAYRPHVTVAYAKKGSVGQLVGNSDLEGKTFESSEIVFSDMDDNMTTIEIGEMKSIKNLPFMQVNDRHWGADPESNVSCDVFLDSDGVWEYTFKRNGVTMQLDSNGDTYATAEEAMRDAASAYERRDSSLAWKSVKSLNKFDQDVLNFLSDEMRGRTSDEIAHRLGIPVENAFESCRKLEQSGLLHAIISNIPGRVGTVFYEITSSGQSLTKSVKDTMTEGVGALGGYVARDPAIAESERAQLLLEFMRQQNKPLSIDEIAYQMGHADTDMISRALVYLRGWNRVEQGLDGSRVVWRVKSIAQSDRMTVEDFYWKYGAIVPRTLKVYYMEQTIEHIERAGNLSYYKLVYANGESEKVDPSTGLDIDVEEAKSIKQYPGDPPDDTPMWEVVSFLFDSPDFHASAEEIRQAGLTSGVEAAIERGLVEQSAIGYGYRLTSRGLAQNGTPFNKSIKLFEVVAHHYDGGGGVMNTFATRAEAEYYLTQEMNIAKTNHKPGKVGRDIDGNVAIYSDDGSGRVESTYFIRQTKSTGVPHYNPLKMETLIEQARRMASGTFPSITGGITRYSEIDKIQQDFVDYCEENAARYTRWQDAWNDFWPLAKGQYGKSMSDIDLMARQAGLYDLTDQQLQEVGLRMNISAAPITPRDPLIILIDQKTNGDVWSWADVERFAQEVRTKSLKGGIEDIPAFEFYNQHTTNGQIDSGLDVYYRGVQVYSVEKVVGGILAHLHNGKSQVVTAGQTFEVQAYA